jgi:Isochorismatase family
MAQQSSNGNRPKLSEKGLLTPDNCAVALIDHQGQMLFGTSNFDRQGIINNTVAFGKAARVFDVPVVLTTVETKSFSGNMWPQLRAVFPGQEPIERSSMNSWDDKNFVAAIEKSGRKKILIAGLWTEVCVDAIFPPTGGGCPVCRASALSAPVRVVCQLGRTGSKLSIAQGRRGLELSGQP